MECAISIVLDLGCEAVQVYNVLCHTVQVFHLEMLELMLSISNWVMRTKGTLEFCDKVDPAVHPMWMVSRITGVEVQFEPFQHHTF